MSHVLQLTAGLRAKVGFANINGKAEGIESKPAFREAFQRLSRQLRQIRVG
jgi:hypothetical protein